MPETTRASFGGCKHFECRVIGYPRPSITWWKDGRDITTDNRYEFDYSVDGTITMIINKVTQKDQGCYQCRAENSEGWAATAAYLHVRVIEVQREEELTSVHKMKFEFGGLKNQDGEIGAEDKDRLNTRYNDFIENIGGNLKNGNLVDEDFDSVKKRMMEKLEASIGGDDDSGLDGSTSTVGTDIGQVSDLWTRKGKNLENISEGIHSDSSIGSETGHDDSAFGAFDSNDSSSYIGGDQMTKPSSNIAGLKANGIEKDSEGKGKGQKQKDDISSNGKSDKHKNITFKFDEVDDGESGKTYAGNKIKQNTKVQNGSASADEEEEEDDVLDQLVDFIGAGKRLSRRPTDDSGFGDDDNWMDSSSDSEHGASDHPEGSGTSRKDRNRKISGDRRHKHPKIDKARGTEGKSSKNKDEPTKRDNDDTKVGLGNKPNGKGAVVDESPMQRNNNNMNFASAEVEEPICQIDVMQSESGLDTNGNISDDRCKRKTSGYGASGNADIDNTTNDKRNGLLTSVSNLDNNNEPDLISATAVSVEQSTYKVSEDSALREENADDSEGDKEPNRYTFDEDMQGGTGKGNRGMGGSDVSDDDLSSSRGKSLKDHMYYPSRQPGKHEKDRWNDSEDDDDRNSRYHRRSQTYESGYDGDLESCRSSVLYSDDGEKPDKTDLRRDRPEDYLEAFKKGRKYKNFGLEDEDDSKTTPSGRRTHYGDDSESDRKGLQFSKSDFDDDIYSWKSREGDSGSEINTSDLTTDLDEDTFGYLRLSRNENSINSDTGMGDKYQKEKKRYDDLVDTDQDSGYPRKSPKSGKGIGGQDIDDKYGKDRKRYDDLDDTNDSVYPRKSRDSGKDIGDTDINDKYGKDRKKYNDLDDEKDSEYPRRSKRYDDLDDDKDSVNPHKSRDIGDKDIDDKYGKDRKKYDDLDDDKDSAYPRKSCDSGKGIKDTNINEKYGKDRKKYDDLDDDRDSGYQRKSRDSGKDIGDTDIDDKYGKNRKKYNDMDDDKDSAYPRKSRDSGKGIGDTDINDKYGKDRNKYDALADDKDSGYPRKSRDSGKDIGDTDIDDKYQKYGKKYDDLNDDKDSGYPRKSRDCGKDIGDADIDDKHKKYGKKYDDLDDNKDSGYPRKSRDIRDADIDDKYGKDRKKYDDLDDDKDSGYQRKSRDIRDKDVDDKYGKDRKKYDDLDDDKDSAYPSKSRDIGDKDIDDKYGRDRKRYDDLDDDKDSGYPRKSCYSGKDIGDADMDDKYKKYGRKYNDLDDDKDSGYPRKSRDSGKDIGDTDINDKYGKDRKKYNDLDDDKDSGYPRKSRDSGKDIEDTDIDYKYGNNRKKYNDLDDDKDSAYPRKSRDSGKGIGDTDINDKYGKDRKKYDALADDNDSGYPRKSGDSGKDIGDTDIDDKYQKYGKKYDDLNDDKDSGYPRKSRDSGKDIGDADIDDKYKKYGKKYDDLDDNKDSGYPCKSRDIRDADIDDKYGRDRKRYDDLDDDKDSGYPRKSCDSGKDIGDADIDDKYKKYGRKYNDLDDDKDSGYPRKSRDSGKDIGDIDIDDKYKKDRKKYDDLDENKDSGYQRKSRDIGDKDIDDKYGKDRKKYDDLDDNKDSGYPRKTRDIRDSDIDDKYGRNRKRYDDLGDDKDSGYPRKSRDSGKDIGDADMDDKYKKYGKKYDDLNDDKNSGYPRKSRDSGKDIGDIDIDDKYKKDRKKYDDLDENKDSGYQRKSRDIGDKDIDDKYGKDRKKYDDLDDNKDSGYPRKTRDIRDSDIDDKYGRNRKRYDDLGDAKDSGYPRKSRDSGKDIGDADMDDKYKKYGKKYNDLDDDKDSAYPRKSRDSGKGIGDTDINDKYGKDRKKYDALADDKDSGYPRKSRDSGKDIGDTDIDDKYQKYGKKYDDLNDDKASGYPRKSRDSGKDIRVADINDNYKKYGKKYDDLDDDKDSGYSRKSRDIRDADIDDKYGKDSKRYDDLDDDKDSGYPRNSRDIGDKDIDDKYGKDRKKYDDLDGNKDSGYPRKSCDSGKDIGDADMEDKYKNYGKKYNDLDDDKDSGYPRKSRDSGKDIGDTDIDDKYGKDRTKYDLLDDDKDSGYQRKSRDSGKDVGDTDIADKYGKDRKKYDLLDDDKDSGYQRKSRDIGKDIGDADIDDKYKKERKRYDDLNDDKDSGYQRKSRDSGKDIGDTDMDEKYKKDRKKYDDLDDDKDSGYLRKSRDIRDAGIDDKYKKDRKRYDDLDDDKDTGYPRKSRDIGDKDIDDKYGKDRKKYDDLDDDKDSRYPRRSRDSGKDIGDTDIDDKYKKDSKKYDDLDDNKDSGYPRKSRDIRDADIDDKYKKDRKRYDDLDDDKDNGYPRKSRDIGDKDIDDKYGKDRKKYDDLDDDKDSRYPRRSRDSGKDIGDTDIDDKYKKDRKKYDDLDNDKDSRYPRRSRDSGKDIGDTDIDDKYKKDRKKYDDLDDNKDFGYPRKSRDIRDADIDDKYKKDRKRYDDLDDDKDTGYPRKSRDIGDKDIDDKYGKDRKKYDDLYDDKDSRYLRRSRDSGKDIGDTDIDDKYKKDRKKYDDLDDNKDSGYPRKSSDIRDSDIDDKYGKDRKKYNDLDDDKDSAYPGKSRDSGKDIDDIDIDDKYGKDRKRYDDLDDDKDSGYPRKPGDSGKDIGDADIDDKYKKDRKKYDDLDDNKDSGYPSKSRDIRDADIDDKYGKDRKKYNDLDDDKDSGYPRKSRDSGKDNGDADIDDKYKKDRKKYDDLDDNKDSGYPSKSRDIRDADIDDKYGKDRKKYDDLDDDKDSRYPRRSRDSGKDIGDTDIDDKYKKDRKKYDDLDDDKDSRYPRRSRDSGKDIGDTDIDDKYKKDRKKYDDLDDNKDSGYPRKSRDIRDADIDDKYKKDRNRYDDLDDDKDTGYPRKSRDIGDKDIDDKYGKDRKKYDDLDDDKDSRYPRRSRDSGKDIGDTDIDDKYKKDRKKYDDLDDNKDSGYPRKSRDIRDSDIDDKYGKDRKKYNDLDDDKDSAYPRKSRDSGKDIEDIDIDDKYGKDRKRYDDLDDDKDSGYPRKPNDSGKDIGDADIDDKYKKDRKKYDDLDDNKDSGYPSKSRDIRDADIDDKYGKDRKKYNDLDDDKDSGYLRKSRDSGKDNGDADIDDKYKKDRKKYDDLDDNKDSGYPSKSRDIRDADIDDKYGKDRKKYDDLDDDKDSRYPRRSRDSGKDIGDTDIDEKYKKDRKKYDDLDDNKDSGYPRKSSDIRDSDIDDKYGKDRKKYNDLDDDKDSAYPRKSRDSGNDIGDTDIDDKYKKNRKRYDDLDDDKDSGYPRKPSDSGKDIGDADIDDKYKKDRKKYDDLDDNKDSGYPSKSRDIRDADIDDKYGKDRKKYNDLDDDKDSGYPRKSRDSGKDNGDADIDDKYGKDRKKYDDLDDKKDSRYPRKSRDSGKDNGDADIDDKYGKDRKKYDDLDDNKDSGYPSKSRDIRDADIDDKYGKDRKKYNDLDDDKDFGYPRKSRDSGKDNGDADIDDKYGKDRKKYDDLDDNKDSRYPRKSRDSGKDNGDADIDDKYGKDRKKYDDVDNDKDSGYPRKSRDSGKDIGDTDIDDKYKKDRKKYDDLDDNKDSGYPSKSRDIRDADIDDKYGKDRKKYNDLDDDKDFGYPRKSRDSGKDNGDADIDDKYGKDRKKYDDLDDNKDSGYPRKSRDSGKDIGDTDIDDKYKTDRKKYDDVDDDKDSGYPRKSRDSGKDIGEKDIEVKYGNDGNMDDDHSNDKISSYSSRFAKPKYGDDDDEHCGKYKQDMKNTDDLDVGGNENADTNRRNKRDDKTPPDLTLGDVDGKLTDPTTGQQGDKNTANSERRTPSPRRPESLPIEKIMPDVTDDMRSDTKASKETDRQNSKKTKSPSKKDDIEQELIQKAKEVTAQIKTLNDAWMSDREDTSSSGDTSPLGHLADTKPDLPNTFFMGVVQSDLHTADRDESRSDEIRGKDDRIGEVGSDKDVLSSLTNATNIRHVKARHGLQPETYTEEMDGNLKPDEVLLVSSDPFQTDAEKVTSQTRNTLESARQNDKIDSLVGYTYDEYGDDSVSDVGQNENAKDAIVGKDHSRANKTKYGIPSFVNETTADQDQEENPDDIPGLEYGQASAEEIPLKKRGLSVHFEDEICNVPDSVKLTDTTQKGGKELTRDRHRKSSSEEEDDPGRKKTDAVIDSSLSEKSKRPDDTDEVSFSTSADIKEGKDVQVPQILKASSDVTIYEGQNLEINWEVQGVPEPRMKIYKDGEPIELFDGMEIVQDGHTWTLSIPDVIRDDAGSYELHVINKHGTDKSEVKVQVHRQTPRTLQKELAAPAFTTPPVDTTVKEGDDLILKCAIQGFPPPQVLWLREGEELSHGEEVEILEEKGNQCLIVWEAGPEHAGHYICRAVNSQGTTEVNFNVDIQDWSSEEEDLHGNDTKSSKSGDDEKISTDKVQKQKDDEQKSTDKSEVDRKPILDEKTIKDENAKPQEGIPKDKQGKKETPKVAEKPKDKSKKPVVEEEMISRKTEKVNECLPDNEDEKPYPSKKEAVPPKPAAKPKDKLRQPVIEEIIQDQVERVNESIPSGETASVTTVEQKQVPNIGVTPGEGTKTPVMEDIIQDKGESLTQSAPIDSVEQALITTVKKEDGPKVKANLQDKSKTSVVEETIGEQASECIPFDEAQHGSVTSVKNDKVPKVAVKPKIKSKTLVVEEIVQDKSETVNECVPVHDTEKASVSTVKTEAVPKVAAKPTEKSKKLAVEAEKKKTDTERMNKEEAKNKEEDGKLDGQMEDGKKTDLGEQEQTPKSKTDNNLQGNKDKADKKKDTDNLDLCKDGNDLDRKEKQETLDKLSKSLGMDDLGEVSWSLDGLVDDTSKQSTDGVKGHQKDRHSYHGDAAELSDEEIEGEPMIPALELHMSNSDEMCAKKYMVIASYHDTTNDVHLESGEVIELLNKMVPTHWLVRKLDDKQQVCYVPAALLQSRRDTDASPTPTPEGLAKAAGKSRQAVQDLVDTEEDYICDLRDLIDNYHDPLQDGSEGEFPDKLLEKKEEIFGNLMDLYNFHNKDLLPELMACADNPDQVAGVFLERRESLKQYLPFWAGREKADEDINSEEIHAFLQSYTKQIGDPDNAFQDLLNRPVERIHEYINLLKNLMKYTSQAGGDCSQLMSVVQMLDDLCQEVDNIMLLDTVQGYDGDIHDLGPVIRHESAMMWDGDPESSEPVEREIFLFRDAVMVASAVERDEDGEPKKLQFDRIIKLRNTDLDHDGFADSRRLEFWDLEDKVKDESVKDSEPLFTLETKSPYSKQAWVRDIKEAQARLGVENTAKMPERRKIKTSKHKVVSSTPRKGSKVVRAEDVESDGRIDDFNILDTSTEAVCVQPEFDDGTSRPVFQCKLEKTVVEEGASAQMECVVAGIPPPKVLWLKNNRPLMATDRCRVIVDGDTNILEFPRARADDTAVYSARAMNVNGSTISTAELYVGEAQPSDLLKYREGIPDNEFRTPAYFFQMKSCQVEEGRLARFDCRVVAYPKPDIIWMKDGKVLTSGERFKLLNFNDEIYSLLIQSVETDDEGRYTCWAHNKYGEAMTEAYLNVLALHDNMDDDDMAPKFLTKFYDQTVTEGVPCDLQCMIAGKPEPSVQWMLNNIELIPTPEIAIVNQSHFCSLKINEVSKANAGKYACLLKNGLGEASCSAGITVIDKKIKGVPMLPKFLKKLCDVTAKTNEDFELEVVVVGEPKPKITWQYNHKPISGSHRRMRKSHEGDVYRLTISDVRLEDDGKFTCKAANSEGEVYCSCNLLVKESRVQLEPADEPSFTQKDFDARYGCAPTFLKKMEDVSMPSGQSAKFECRIMGIPEPTVQWFKNGVPISQGKKYWVSQDSAGNCGLQVYDVSAGDEGIYTCTLTNPAGETSANASLRIGKPKESMERDFPSKTTKGRRLSREDMLDSTRSPTMSRDEPTIKSTRPDTVRLSWAPAPTSGLPQEARNIRYIVESKALPNADWKTIGDGIHSNTYMAKHLNPDKEYAFRVRAENQFGQSDPTQPARLERIKFDEKIEKKKVILPESKRPPSLPSTRPVITDYGQESVRLAWKPAPPPVTIKKPLPVSYRVEAQELPSTDWLPMASGLSTPSLYLPQLQDRHDYNIRVRAENKYGVSEPSEPLWLPRAHSFPGVPIRRPEIVEMEPEFVKLSWERVNVPPTTLDEEPLTYMIEMQEPPNRDWREIAQGVRDPHYKVRDLRPGNDYRFRVRSRSLAGPLSEPSPATSLYRTMATTRVPIDRLQLDDHELDTEGINLSWNRVNIPPYHRDDEPLLYMVEMMEQPIDDWRPVVSGIPTQRYRVTDIAPDRDYKFRVRALSSYGISPPSYALPVSYRRPLPSPSRPILDHTPRLLYDDTDSLALTWQPPTLDSTRPLRYRVQMQAPPSMDWRTMASDIPDTRYRIRGLGPSRDYLFRVVPETSLGQLDPLPSVPLSSLPTPRTFHPSRPDILDIEPTSLGLSWKRPVVDMYTPLTYNIEMQEPPSLLWRNIHSGLTNTHHRVSGLQPSRDYMFRVVPVTNSGQLEPLPPVSISSMPVIPRMQNLEPSMTEMGRDSIKLSWRPAEVPFYRRNPLPVHYTVEMRTLPSSEWIPTARRVKDTSYIVKGLNPKNDYEFRIKAETDYGCSSPTCPVTVHRKAVPVFPRREPVISNMSPDSISLSWQPATLPGHSTRIPVYQIEVQDPPSIGQWRPITNNVSQTSYNVVGLRPDRDYLFRIRAKVDGTLGEPTLPVYLMRRCGPPRMPNDHPYVHDIQPTSVRLQWRSVELSPRHTDYSPVTYRLEVQEGTRSDWVTLAGRIPHTDFHVTNLTPDQEYSFRVRAENKYGVSEPTNHVHIKRRAVAPSLPQDEPLLYDVGGGSITLSWRSADVPSFSTSPVTYTIFVQESPSATWLPLVKRIPHTWYILNGIRPDRDYTFRVQAENEFGVSRPTLPVRLFHTEYKVPIELPEIDEFDEKSSSVNLRWRPRSMTPYEGEPLRYHVESWEPRKRTWRRLASDLPDTSYRVTGVSSNQENIFRIRAQSKATLSEPTYPISLSRYLFPMPRPQLHDLEPEAVRLSWNPYQHSRPRMSSLPSLPHLPHLPSVPRRYELELRELGTQDWRSVATVPDTSYYYRGLRPRQDYQFRVRGISDQGPSDLYSSPVTLYRRTALPRVPLSRPEVMSVQDETVDLSWSRVEVPATQFDETPLTYIIESQQLPGYDWSPVARGIPDTNYRVTGLRRNQDYAFRIRGELPSGLSEPSPYVPVYRRPSESKIIIKKYPSMISTSISPRTLLSQYYFQQVSPAAGIIAVKTRDDLDTSTLHASARPANVCVDRRKLLTNVNDNIKTRRDFFLAELERIDTEWQKKHLKKVRKIDLKPPLPPKHAAKTLAVKPPLSPRSRREQFMQDGKRINTKIPTREKSIGFSSALEKFKRADVERDRQPRIGIQEDDVRKAVRGTELTKVPSRTALRKKYASDLDLSINKFKVDQPYIKKAFVPERSNISKTDFYAPRLNLLKRAFDDNCTTIGRHHGRPSRITENAQKYVSRDYHRRASSWHGFISKYSVVGRSSSVTRDMSLCRSVRASSVDLMSRSYIPKRSQSYSGVAPYRDPSLSRIGLSWYHDRTSSNMSFARNRSASAYDLARKPSVPPMTLHDRYSSTEYLTRRDNSLSITRDAGRSTRGVSLPPVSASNKYSSSEYLTKRDYSPSVTRDTRRSYRGMSQPPVSASDTYSSSEYLSRRDRSSSLTRESMGRDSSLSTSRAPTSYRSNSMSVIDGYIPMSTSSTRNTYVPKTRCFRDSSPSPRLASIPATPPMRESSPFISRGSPLLSRKGSVDTLRQSVGMDRGSLRESSIMKTRHLTPQRLRTMSVSSSCGSLYDTTPSSSRAQSIISRSPSKDYSDSLKDRNTSSWIRKVVSGFRKHIA